MRRTVFSVIVAAYNTGKRILPTLRSALGQEYRDFEVIVVGDGCSDDTGEVIAANFGDKVRWTNLPQNSGSQSRPNNEGVRRARGTHIAYLGHDDIWSPRHLGALAETIDAHDPDFAVSGTLYHTPLGCDVSFLTGIFDDTSTAAREFYPPSSIAHRRDMLDKIGAWPDPLTINRPVDIDLQLRASEAGCRFVSTKKLTVHKFAAGHRFLSYRFPSAAEQEAMLANLSDPTFEERLLTGLLARTASGAGLHRMELPHSWDPTPGSLFRAARRAKGLELAPMIDIDRPRFLAVYTGPAALDWETPEPDDYHMIGSLGPVYGKVRWAGCNPNPNYWLNVRIARAFTLRIHIAAFAERATADALRLKINDREAPYAIEWAGEQAGVLVVRSGLPLKADEGLRIEFQTFAPGSPLPRIALRGRRFALAGFEIIPDDEAGTKSAFEQVLTRALSR